MRFKILIVLLLIALWAGLALAWTEPVEIDGNRHLGAPRVVAVGETLHVIAVNPPKAYYLYSRDNGQTWSQPVMPIDTSLRIEMPDLHYSNSNLYLVWADLTTFYPQLYFSKSSDGGRTWQNPRQVFVNSTSRVVNFPTLATNGESLFVACAVDSGYPFLRSYNAGQTWQDSTNIDWGPLAIIQYPRLRYSQGVLHFIYPMHIFEDSLTWEVYYKRSTDLGLTWSERIILSPAESTHVPSQLPYAEADTAGRVLVTWMDYANGSMCGTSGDIFYRMSLNNGETWGPVGSITNTQSGENSNILCLGDKFYVVWNDNSLLGCGHPKECYSVSTDFGWSWETPKYISGLESAIEGWPSLIYTIQEADTIFHCLYWKWTPENTGSLYYVRSQDFVSANEPSPPHADEINIGAYPNPFNSSTTISISEPSSVIISIYDIAGRKIASLNAAMGEAVWDASGCASGIYFAKAEGNKGISKTIKLILLK